MDVALFALAYYCTAVGQRAPGTVTGLLLVAWLVRVAAGLPSWAVVVCLATAIVGPAFEASWSALGFFSYRHPDFFGVAEWLPALYLHTGVAALAVTDLLYQGRSASSAA
jgi:hypothetical protein